ncbi:hypothetical protein ElyMa_005486300 [Elysia marginata]|uniref:Uncharacterized protein n=1 Tax=Elysia marginata TaxID=1093978 RepID=A0AAV4ERE0_9GAST|nr:hypothetical protein ElyMa_005486300 [Elysia marginata]
MKPCWSALPPEARNGRNVPVRSANRHYGKPTINCCWSECRRFAPAGSIASSSTARPSPCCGYRWFSWRELSFCRASNPMDFIWMSGYSAFSSTAV